MFEQRLSADRPSAGARRRDPATTVPGAAALAADPAAADLAAGVDGPVRDGGPVDGATLAGWVRRLGRPDRAAGDAQRIDQIRLLEELKSAAAAAQAMLTADFAASQTAAQRAAGVPAERAGRGIAAQVALARRESPHRGGRHLGLANALAGEMPGTLAALRAGRISEWRATVLVRETACLTAEDRRAVDAALADRLAELGDRETEAAARAAAYRIDPHAVTARAAAAAADRRVTLRPAPDTMTRLGALLPAAQGVAAYASLSRHADTARATGDPRSRGQIMADTLVERLTGQATAEATPVEVTLLITDTTLFGDQPPGHPTGPAAEPAGPAEPADQQPTSARPADQPDQPDRPEDGVDDHRGDDHRGEPAGGEPGRAGPRPGDPVHEPAYLLGYGPIPAPAARDLIRDSDATMWLRRVFTRPDTGELVAMESRRRLFPDALRRFLVLRDQVCRTPWCGAPIRHADHVTPAGHGGPTSADNGQGLCEACNHARQAVGFSAEPSPAGTAGGGGGASVTITTPTGHTYTSRPPPPPGRRPPPADRPPPDRHPPPDRGTGPPDRAGPPDHAGSPSPEDQSPQRRQRRTDAA